MPRKRITEHVEVLRAKLHSVNKLLCSFETHLKAMEGAIYVEGMFQETEGNFDAARVLEVLKDAMVPLALLGPHSLIDAELEKEVAPDDREQVLVLFRSVKSITESPERWCIPNDSNAMSHVRSIGGQITKLNEAMLRPALRVRQRLIDELNSRAACESKATPKQKARKKRDEAIEEILDKDPKLSSARIVELLKGRMDLKAFLDREEIKLTRSAVDNVVKKYKGRHKPRRRKPGKIPG